MEINVAQLLKGPIGGTRTHNVSDLVDVLGDGQRTLVYGEVNLVRTQRGILVNAHLETEAKANCGRCLREFTMPLPLHIEEEYVPTFDIITGVPLASPEDPESFTIDEHHIIDLDEAIRQYALLAIPIKPLCREDCAGLCQSCGRNLNEGSCECPTTDTDPRWAKLRQLL